MKSPVSAQVSSWVHELRSESTVTVDGSQENPGSRSDAARCRAIDVGLDEHPPGAVGPDGRIPAPDPKLGPFAGLIDGPGIATFDATVDGWADRLRGNTLADRVFYGLSKVGDHGMVWHAIALARIPVSGETFADAGELSSLDGYGSATLSAYELEAGLEPFRQIRQAVGSRSKRPALNKRRRAPSISAG